MLLTSRFREDFPILQQTVYGKPLVYLDNAATTQKPQVVLDKVMTYYTSQNSNIHRGVHSLGERAGAAYEAGRESVRSFINAKDLFEVIFTRGTTESINLVAHSFGQAFVSAGDEIIVTQMEHHSNIVPWQALCNYRGATLKVVPVDENGKLKIDVLGKLITDKTRLLAVTYVSNALGTVNPIEEIIDKAHEKSIPVLVDAAQAAAHRTLDVQQLDCDFLVFSGHKMYAETGIGVLYGKQKWLDAMPPYQLGGGMIANVSFAKTTYADLPLKFEAGTGNVAAVVSLAAAIDYLNQIGPDTVAAHENKLINDATQKLTAMEGVTLYGNKVQRSGSVSFNLDGAHPYDVGMILDKLGIAVRTGMHCAEPLMQHLGVSGTVRASFALYNTLEEIEQLMAGLQKAKDLLSP